MIYYVSFYVGGGIYTPKPVQHQAESAADAAKQAKDLYVQTGEPVGIPYHILVTREFFSVSFDYATLEPATP